MRILITGVTGMAGSHLAEYVLATHPEAELFGMCRWRSRMDNLDDLATLGKLNTAPLECRVTTREMLDGHSQPGKLNLVYGELNDPLSLRIVMTTAQPDRLFHLAAQSYVQASWSAPSETLQTNVIGQVNLFEAIRAAEIDPLIHVAGSSEEYGQVLPHELPIKETNPLRPLSPYAVSKIAQENLAWQYHRSYGLRTVATRGFNHEGPRRGDVFVTSSFARQLATIEAGLQNPPVIQVGDLSCERDWTDVRDMVRAYWLALERGAPGEVYNIGSGVRRSVEQMLQLLLTMTGAQVEVRPDPARLRPSDVKVLQADCQRLRELTGWEPEIPFQETLEDLLNYWRGRVRRDGAASGAARPVSPQRNGGLLT
ncbi:GDP-mannose 4,6-dehydratase [Chloroflexota bacterium]